ncbi:Crp/Fnr family transcriptional regulator [Nonlabens sp. Asnod3-H03]|uniref:Crp/Fnr family transcriptional regulator n=1 Tax=Nonlabens sp. Asnod3-H03 TaxID=3160580 RepID=UPI003865A4EE
MSTKCENCVIRQYNALRVLNTEDLAEINATKKLQSVSKGDMIFKEGQRLSGIYCVRNGATKLSKITASGRDQIVKIASKGEILGQRSIVCDENANLSATALNDMEVCFIPKSAIKNRIAHNPLFVKELLVNMATELRIADDMIVNLSEKTVKQRLAQALLYLKKQFGEDPLSGDLTLVLSREDLAAAIGTATESCIRLLSDFKKKGYITTQGKNIKILQLDALEELTKDF